MKNVIKTLSYLFLIGLFLTACSGDDGVDGINGVDGVDGINGADGANGADGVDGADGEDGATGTANVIYSDWISSEFGGESAATETSILLESFGLGDYNQTTDLMLVYGRREVNALSNEIHLLPYTLLSQNELYRYRTTNGSTFTALYVEGATTDGGTNLFTYFNAYRYVIIPGGVLAEGTSAKSDVDYKSMSYKEIAAFFNITE